MRIGTALRGLVLLAACSLGAGCTNSGFPATLGPSSCAAGGDRCAALNCPAGTHCALTSNCTALCEQEQLVPH
jgi:hypothetical protein